MKEIMVQEFQDIIRIQVNRHIFDHGFAPTIIELARDLKSSESEIKAGLKQLSDNHAIVLHPNSFDIWVAHPFALFPTLFWVEAGDRRWWGNCTWCSLGIASLTHTRTKIYTKVSGESTPLQIDIIDNKIVKNDLVVHFLIPAKKLWENVIYTCANMLTFENETQVDDWCRRHNKPKGQVVTIDKAWELAKVWYGNYLEDTWTRKTPEYAQSLFEKVGLTGDFWKVR
jgi:hypothetical protein